MLQPDADVTPTFGTGVTEIKAFEHICALCNLPQALFFAKKARAELRFKYNKKGVNEKIEKIEGFTASESVLLF